MARSEEIWRNILGARRLKGQWRLEARKTTPQRYQKIYGAAHNLHNIPSFIVFPLRKRAARAPSNREFLLACSGNAHWWGKRSACADCPLVDVNKKQSMRTRSYHATSETRPPPHLPSHPHQHDIQRYITFKMTPGNNKRKLEDMSEFVSLLNTCEVANQFHFVLRLLMRHCSWRRHR